MNSIIKSLSIISIDEQKEEEIDTLSRKDNLKSKGPITKYLESLRKLSNKSDTSKLSISTQYSTKIDTKNEQEELSEISDFELEPNEDSFHSSLNNSRIDSDQVVSFSDDFELICDDEEKISNFYQLNNFKSSPIIKPLINVNSFQY